MSEADDAVQEAWIRANRADVSVVENLNAWLTTIVARVCLNMLQSRSSRREEPLDTYVPDPIVTSLEGDPEAEALLAESVGLALMVVLETLSPPERLAFVLHDVFGTPFEEIATILNRSPAATRQLASRARRRVQDTPVPDTGIAEQREVVDAFIAASREGDFDALVAVLDPDIVLRSDGGARVGATAVVRGAAAVAGGALRFAHLAAYAHPVLVNGAVGVVVAPQGRPYSILAFTVRNGRIAAINVLADPDRLSALRLPPLDG